MEKDECSILIQAFYVVLQTIRNEKRKDVHLVWVGMETKMKDFFWGFLFRVYLVLVNKLNFQIIFNLKYDLFYSQADLLSI